MSIYHLLEEPKDVGWIGCWSNYTGEFDEIIGYSFLGAIFLRSSASSTYLVLYPLRSGNNAKNYGVFSSIEEFESKILQESSFSKSCIDPVKLEELEVLSSNVGALEAEEVYFPAPHPSIGGSWEIETYKKGNVWVFADIAGQNRGLE